MSFSLPYSTLYLSLLSALALMLAILVVRIRGSEKIGLGDGGDKQMMRQIRVHANLLENLIPFALLYMLAEIQNMPGLFLHLVGIAFIIARLMHASGLSKSSGATKGRYYGTVVSWIVILCLIAVNLYYSILYFIQ